MKKNVLSLLLLVIAFGPAAARPNASDRKFYSFDALLWNNPYLSRPRSAAAMVFSAKDLSLLNSFSECSLQGRYDRGDFKDFHQGRTYADMGLYTASYLRLKNIFLHGHFSYDYGRDTRVRWRGFINPRISPFMLADSVAGSFSLERYDMSASIGVPLSESLSIGLALDYKVYSGVKRKDLRNKNTYMDFTGSPSVAFHAGHFSMALSASYRKVTEQVAYTQVEESAGKTLFSLNGLWFNTQTIYAATTPATRILHDVYCGGALQLSFDLGAFRFFNHLRIDYKRQDQKEDLVTPRQYGFENQMLYGYSGLWQYGLRHRLALDCNYSRGLGYKPVQRQELNPKARLYEWIQYGSVHTYSQDILDAGAQYSFRVLRNPLNAAWEFAAGARLYRIDTRYTEYPACFNQEVGFMEFRLSGKRNFLLREAMFELCPRLLYGGGEGSLCERTDEEDCMQCPDAQWQLTEALEREFAFNTADRLGAGMALRYTRFLNQQKGLNLFVDLDFQYTRALNQTPKGESRILSRLKIGATF